jgi:hypothetical protein
MHGIAQSPTHASNSTAGAVTRAHAHTNCFLKNTSTFPHACSALSITLTSCFSRLEGEPPDQRSALACGRPSEQRAAHPTCISLRMAAIVPCCSQTTCSSDGVLCVGVSSKTLQLFLDAHFQTCKLEWHEVENSRFQVWSTKGLSSIAVSALVHCVPTCNGQPNAKYRVVRSRSRSSRSSSMRWTCVCRGDVP